MQNLHLLNYGGLSGLSRTQKQESDCTTLSFSIFLQPLIDIIGLLFDFIDFRKAFHFFALNYFSHTGVSQDAVIVPLLILSRAGLIRWNL